MSKVLVLYCQAPEDMSYDASLEVCNVLEQAGHQVVKMNLHSDLYTETCMSLVRSACDTNAIEAIVGIGLGGFYTLLCIGYPRVVIDPYMEPSILYHDATMISFERVLPMVAADVEENSIVHGILTVPNAKFSQAWQSINAVTPHDAAEKVPQLLVDMIRNEYELNVWRSPCLND